MQFFYFSTVNPFSIFFGIGFEISSSPFVVIGAVVVVVVGAAVVVDPTVVVIVGGAVMSVVFVVEAPVLVVVVAVVETVVVKLFIAKRPKPSTNAAHIIIAIKIIKYCSLFIFV